MIVDTPLKYGGGILPVQGPVRAACSVAALAAGRSIAAGGQKLIQAGWRLRANGLPRCCTDVLDFGVSTDAPIWETRDMPFIGEFAALGTSLCFSFGSTMFTLAGRAFGSILANRVRLLVAVLITMLLHLFTYGQPLPL